MTSPSTPSQQYISLPLGKHHDRAVFTCGNSSIDDYLKSYVSQDQDRQLTRCHVLTPSETSKEILGYYTLAAHTIITASAPEDFRKASKYPHIPAILIGRLGIDTKYHGNGIGRALLAAAVKHCARLGQELGIAAIVVDALDKRAVTFYERYNFKLFADQVGDEYPKKLYLNMRPIIRELARVAT